jgi:hypothetical protein
VNDISGIKDHFFPITPGAYNFHCELELPGFAATGKSGTQLIESTPNPQPQKTP